MAINTFARKEIKFLLDMAQYESLMEEIPLHMNADAFCVDGKEYGVYNIYYDTEDDFLIRESLSKPYYKEKIRLRSYFSPALGSFSRNQKENWRNSCKKTCYNDSSGIIRIS